MYYNIEHKCIKFIVLYTPNLGVAYTLVASPTCWHSGIYIGVTRSCGKNSVMDKAILRVVCLGLSWVQVRFLLGYGYKDRVVKTSFLH